MKPESKQYTSMVGGKPITFETGTLAGQAGVQSPFAWATR